ALRLDQEKGSSTPLQRPPYHSALIPGTSGARTLLKADQKVAQSLCGWHVCCCVEQVPIWFDRIQERKVSRGRTGGRLPSILNWPLKESKMPVLQGHIDKTSVA
ncbi:hypothetical protein, partial [Bradyrhizobium sp. 23]|uniref:hypothetical protein n=1 Tax=Bradyrhizobium sp. 23 TaxID=2782667 RepID=UPI001FFBA747